MFVESFHQLLKVVYLNNKQNRRVDQLVHVLLRIAGNLVFEHLQKVEKGKLTHRKTEINKRHKAAVSMHTSLVTCLTEIPGKLNHSAAKVPIILYLSL